MREKIIELYYEGNTTDMIAMLLGISEATVVDTLEDAGLI